jgi:integrase
VLSIKTAFEGACQRARIEDLHFHDLRREFGLRLHERGVPLSTIQRLLGHSDITTTSRYLRVEDRGLDGVLDVLEIA